jgi:hypothetical protein
VQGVGDNCLETGKSFLRVAATVAVRIQVLVSILLSNASESRVLCTAVTWRLH